MAGELSMGKVIKAYLALRAEKEAIDNEAKAKTDDIKTKLGKFEAWIQAEADKTGVQSFKTEHGTAFLTTTDFAGVGDWDAVLAFIKNNEAYDLLERRVNKTAVRSYMDAHRAVPDGVNFGTKISVNVRKPAKKAE